ncbi:hypothetical protein UU5_18747 [Rhodanobacter sp. 115]|nr:hypothetical protein UU5_18747 [Rhodanobacter sp. 115]
MVVAIGKNGKIVAPGVLQQMVDEFVRRAIDIQTLWNGLAVLGENSTDEHAVPGYGENRDISGNKDPERGRFKLADHSRDA